MLHTTPQKQFTSQYDIDVAAFHPIYLFLLAHFLIEFQNFLTNFIIEVVIFSFFDYFMTQHVPIKLLQHRKQSFSQLNQSLIHFSPTKYINPQRRSFLNSLLRISTIPHPPRKTITHNIPNYFILISEFTLISRKSKRLR